MRGTKVLCTSCDIYCLLLADVEDGQVVRVRPTDPRPLRANICMKGANAPQGFRSPRRLLHPLKRAGVRGDGAWVRVSWDEALDDIAARLKSVIDRYGPEGFAVATSQWNTGTENGAGRRFMNLLGSPNWIGGVAMCAGNTAAINRYVYGWFPYPDYANTKCITLFGHNPRKHSWTPVYNSIRRAQEQGAKLIVLDPRRNTPGVIPWTPVTDQQRNSTSAIRLHCALRALTGSLDVKGGEILHGFNPLIVSESELELHEALSETQQRKQLGSDRHPAFTYRGTAALSEPTERVWGYRHANIVAGSYMATPSATFRAMADGDPYPVKAFFALGNNTLLSFANMQLIQRALLNQDLVVVHEQFMTPTAQLADYVLPGDSWLERSALADGFGWTAIYRSSVKAVEPPGECRGVYEFWRELAVRMGLGEQFPWRTNEEMLDHRVSRTGSTFEEFARTHAHFAPEMHYKKYEQTGFATPSGKVELASSVLGDLGFDPLPYYRGEPPADPRYPLMLFTDVRDDEFFQTGHRHIESREPASPTPKSSSPRQTPARSASPMAFG